MKTLLNTCIKEYTWIHTSIGLLGNICFIIGSVLFMRQNQSLGIWFFIAGSTGMLIGNAGNAAAMYVQQRWRRRRGEQKGSE